MKKHIIFLLLALLFPAICQAASLGELTFNVADSDLSKQYLMAMFGKVETAWVGGGTTVLSIIFQVFNSAVLSIGGMILMYIMIVSTINTAQSGEVLGKQWSSVWIPVRSSVGIGLLLPKASGYCTLQTIMMWLIVQGIGIADRVWEKTIDYLDQGGELITTAIPSEVLTGAMVGNYEKLSRYYVQVGSCMYALEKELQNKATNNSTKRVPNFRDTVKFDGNDLAAAPGELTIKFPGNFSANDAAYNAYTGKCGSVTVKHKGSDLGRCQFRMMAEEDLFASMSALGKKYVDSGYKEITGEEDTIAYSTIEYAYMLESVTQGAASFVAPTTATGAYDTSSSTFGDAKKEGWITAGAYYYRITQKTGRALDDLSSFDTTPGVIVLSSLQGALNTVSSKSDSYFVDIKSYPELIAGSNSIPEKVAGSDSLLSYYLDIDADGKKDGTVDKKGGAANGRAGPIFTENITNHPPPSGDMKAVDVGTNVAMLVIIGVMGVILTVSLAGITAAAGNIVAGVFIGIAAGLGVVKICVGMGILMAGTFSNPLVPLIAMGYGLLDIGGAVVITSIAGFIPIQAAAAIMSWANPAGYAIQTAATVMAPLLTMIVGVFMGAGGFLVLFVPLIPCLIFLFGVIGWFFSVLEAMVAATLVGLGLIHPEGHEAFGKAESALMLSLNVFLRPSMMIIGFLVASVLSYVCIWLLNKSVFKVSMDVMFGSVAAFGLGFLFVFPFYLVVYCLIPLKCNHLAREI